MEDKNKLLREWKEIQCLATVNTVYNGELCCIIQYGTIVHGNGCSKSCPYYNLEEE